MRGWPSLPPCTRTVPTRTVECEACVAKPDCGPPGKCRTLALREPPRRHRDGSRAGAAARRLHKLGGNTMMLKSVSTRSLLLAGTFVAVFALAGPASAQQPAAPAAPAAGPQPGVRGAPNQPLYGRPENESAMKLAPVPAPPIAAAADKLPVDKLKLPKGFKIEVFASGIPDARSIRIGDKGTVFIANRVQDKVWALYAKDGKRVKKPIITGMYKPNGLAFHDGTLYVAETNKVWKLEKIEDNLDNPPKPVLVYDDLPTDEAHNWKFIAIGPDNKLYVPVGQPCNNCIPDDKHGQIRRMNLDGTGVELVAKGVRNTVGFDWHPATHELYFTDNG